MTNEQILTEIRGAMELNKEARIKSNEALSHAMNALASKEIYEYNRGLATGWDIFVKLLNMNSNERETLFGMNFLNDILKSYSLQEVMKKIESYDSSKVNFSAGDKVKHNTDNIVAVILDKTSVDSIERMWQVYTENGHVESWNESEIDKTGECVDMQSLFVK